MKNFYSLIIVTLLCSLAGYATLKGDVNGDGAVNVSDITALYNYILNGEQSFMSTSDVNADGAINSSDVTAVYNMILNGTEPQDNITKFTVNGVDFNMVDVEGGVFMMGAADNDGNATNQEKPAHQVSVTSFAIGQTEVTQELWQAVMGTNPGHFSGTNLPVEGVSWTDCQNFIATLNQLVTLEESYEFRLPTEAEWEYAARGGDKSQGYLYAGSNSAGDVAWYNNNADSAPHTVGTKAPNELNLYDMSGNVYEWCYDKYADYTSNPQVDPAGAMEGANNHVLRGGSWYQKNSNCRITNRNSLSYDNRLKWLGLRLVIALKRESYTVNGVSFNMIPVTGGTFTMGGTQHSLEKPKHQVTTFDFAIAQTEVTQELWQAVMSSNPSAFSGSNLPVENVSWNDCQNFITSLNNLVTLPDGYEFRLPTEAEWEFAARGGNYSKNYTYAGSNSINDVAWINTNSNSKTHQVATKAQNELGLFDMSGNVDEWCGDWYVAYTSSAQVDPIGPYSGSNRIKRGGSWKYSDAACRVSMRNYDSPSTCANNLGMRLVIAPKASETFTINLSDGNSISFKMINVRGGTFDMGCDNGYLSVTPIHQVTLSSYSIGEMEVTGQLWEAVMNGIYYTGTIYQRPVSDVTWNECQQFIVKLNQLTGKIFRLPTEAEWEYAARGGVRTHYYYYSGSQDLDNVAWHRDNVGDDWTPRLGGLKAPNELGIYDMSGNVQEWCNDWYSAYTAEAQTNPTGSATGTNRVYRGGCLNDWGYNLQVAYRYHAAPSYAGRTSGGELVELMGLRLAQ